MTDNPFGIFNAAISEIEIPPLSGPTPKALFICGTPRSGTTILCQSVTYCADVGYIDNLVARFAANPELGVLLSQSINLPKRFTGKSDYGQTSDLTEPHEFGQGWARLLAPSGVVEPEGNQALDPTSLERLERLIRRFGKPAVFKSFAYLWYIDKIAAALPNACWLHVTRDLTKTSQSLETLYTKRADEQGPPIWTSAVMQKTMERASNAPLAERCFQQISDIDEHIRAQLAPMAAPRKLEVALEDYVSDPVETTRMILNHFEFPYDANALSDLI